MAGWREREREMVEKVITKPNNKRNIIDEIRKNIGQIRLCLMSQGVPSCKRCMMAYTGGASSGDHPLFLESHDINGCSNRVSDSPFTILRHIKTIFS